MKVVDQVSAILKQKTGPVRTIDPDDTVFVALELMASYEIGALLVIEDGKLTGILSERDYARKIILQGRASKETSVSDIMVAPPTTVAPETSVEEAMRIMTENRIRHLPVVGRDGAILGIVSIGDVIKWIITSQGQTIEHLENYIASGG